MDAAADPQRVLALVKEGSRTAHLDLVVTTHGHRDHYGALESIVAVTGAQVAAGARDAAALPALVAKCLHQGDVLTLGHVTLEVIHLRGHTPGSVALAYREPQHVTVPEARAGRVHLFTGDSLFPGGPGRTNSAEDFRTLMADLEDRVFGPLGDDTWVYPGHGADTTLGAEREALPSWWARGW